MYNLIVTTEYGDWSATYNSRRLAELGRNAFIKELRNNDHKKFFAVKIVKVKEEKPVPDWRFSS